MERENETGVQTHFWRLFLVLLPFLLHAFLDSVDVFTNLKTSDVVIDSTDEVYSPFVELRIIVLPHPDRPFEVVLRCRMLICGDRGCLQECLIAYL
jgi:hypothetical protein